MLISLAAKHVQEDTIWGSSAAISKVELKIEIDKNKIRSKNFFEQ